MNEYKYELFKNGKVLCQLCGKEYKIISPTHLKKDHNITFGEYKLRFPKAPVSGVGFKSLSVLGKEKNIFVEKEFEKFDNPEIEEYDEPIIDEEINLSMVLDNLKSTSTDICVSSKELILDYLKSYFTHIKKDYMIQVNSIDERLLFEFITDFADPELKIDIEFPNTFWHNRMSYIDPNRDLKLKEHGWKIIEIKSNNPKLENIIKSISGL